MARAHHQSIPTPTGSEQPGPPQTLRRWLASELRQLRPVLASSAHACQADRYRKHFDSFGHACLLLFHGLSGGQSLRQSYAAFATCPGLMALSGLSPARPQQPLAVSFSHFAASNSSRPAAFLAGLIPHLAAQVRQTRVGCASLPPLDVRILDSTFLRLSLQLAGWLPGRGGADVPGLRLQLLYQPALDLPEHILLTDTRHNDCQGLDQSILHAPARLAALQGCTLVVDLGYYSHARFAALRQAGVHLVCRLHPQARYHGVQQRAVQSGLPTLAAGRIQVHGDQDITLGSATNRAGAVLPRMRLVTATVAPTASAARQGAAAVVYRLVTDRRDLAPDEVVQLYLWRWQIELFFRWLKQHIHLPRLLGYSRNAVELTVWLAVVVHLLCLLATTALGRTRRSPTLLAQLPWTLAQLGPADLPIAVPHRQQLALPGWPHPTRLPP